MMINGQWAKDWNPVQAKDEKGRFVRQTSSFRHQIVRASSARRTGKTVAAAEADFIAEPGRYRLYAAYICPWACRTLIARKLKGLEEIIPVTIVNPVLTSEGWAFGGHEEADEDPELGAHHIHQLYSKANPTFTGRATVPVLWDSKTGTIVNNESADILRIFNKAFEGLVPDGPDTIDLYPDDLAADIDALNARVYGRYNNGVYKAGFATTQAAYDEAVTSLFDEMAALDDQLSDGRPYLFGNRLTEADIRVFVTSIRFDAAYHGLFKCNIARLSDFPHLHAHMVRMLEVDAVRETVRLDHIKAGYYSIKALNPNGIVPKGPAAIEALLNKTQP